MAMGRNKLVKRIVLLLLAITCIISVFIFFNLYIISTSELQTFPAWEYLQEEPLDPVELLEKDSEIIELEKKIDYILKLYKNGNQPDLGLDLAGSMDQFYKKNIKFKHNHHMPDTKHIDSPRKPKFKPAAHHLSPTTKIPKKVSFPDKKTSTSGPGILNVHIWEGWCGPRVEDLKRDKHFPLYPSFKTNLSLFFSQWNEAGYGERIFGYLHPPETGNYIFAVSCDDNCEIWLSNSSDPIHIQKIAFVGTLKTPANTKLANFRQYQSQISKQLHLVAGKQYYIEALHKQAAYKDHLLLTWLAPSWQRIRTISSKYISSFISGDLENKDIEDYAMYIPETPATLNEQIYNNIGNIYYFNRTKYKFGSSDKRFQIISVNIGQTSDFINVLPSTNYKPSYVIDFVPKRYEGVKLIHESAIYPNDNTALTHMYSYEDCLTHRQNHPHLSGLFPGNSFKTSIDEENWFSRLTYDKKFKYLHNLYSKKISYLLNNQNENNEMNSDTYYTEVTNTKYTFPDRLAVKTESIGQEVLEKSTEVESFPDAFQEKGQVNNDQRKSESESLSFKARRLLSVQKKEVINESYFTLLEKGGLLLGGPASITKKYDLADGVKLNNREQTSIKENSHYSKHPHHLRTSSVEYEMNAYSNVDDDVLPQNLMENSVRENPISIPLFVKSSHVHNPFQKSTQRTYVTQVNNEDMVAVGRQPFIPKRKAKIHPLIFNKIYFKDGVFYNGTNASSPDHYNMGWLYNIFGSSIYHLSQVPERYFQWLYNQHLSDCKTDGNLRLSEEIALGVVYDYMDAIRLKHGRKYKLKDVINIEENHDIIHGDRYLIEIDLTVQNEEQPQRLSRYIYRPLGSQQLFEINEFQWNPHATVHIIIPVKDQGRWVKHFITNMERIYTEKKDPYLNIILVDFNSTDINIEKCLQSSKLKRYQVISLDGPFQRALGVQAGADAVSNPNDIVFTCDLHLEIPSHLIDSIRKHTIKEKMAFAPMVFRLSCGYTPELPFGLWEIQGYGLFAISKYDFDRIGGMNTKEFKTKWGGEDWEFLDRVLEFGLEVERMRIPQFYHYYHSKKRMWVTPKTTLPPIVNVDGI